MDAQIVNVTAALEQRGAQIVRVRADNPLISKLGGGCLENIQIYMGILSVSALVSMPGFYMGHDPERPVFSLAFSCDRGETYEIIGRDLTPAEAAELITYSFGVLEVEL